MPLILVLACVAIACSGITDEITNVEANSLIIFLNLVTITSPSTKLSAISINFPATTPQLSRLQA